MLSLEHKYTNVNVDNTLNFKHNKNLLQYYYCIITVMCAHAVRVPYECDIDKNTNCPHFFAYLKVVIG